MTTPRVKIVADSIASNGVRLTTVTIRLWRPLLAEFNTHRSLASSQENLSSNAASSRALPVGKMIERATFTPEHWGENQAGMQARGELGGDDRLIAELDWREAASAMQAIAKRMSARRVHKSIPNRLLEVFMETEIVCSFTDSGEHSGIRNFLAQRTERSADGTPMAEPHFADVAEELLAVLNAHEPRSVELGDWHLPFASVQEDADPVTADERFKLHGLNALQQALVLSVARTARVSYLKHDRAPATFAEDLALYTRLRLSGHWSPFEHQGMALANGSQCSGNFVGWEQFRKTFGAECRTFERLGRKVWGAET